MSFSTTKPWKMSEKQRAFYEYKKAVAKHGKPFFPYGVWHDVIAAAVVMAIIIGMTVIWFAQANCDSWTNVSCNRVATPHQQEQFTPDKPGEIKLDKKGELDAEVDKPLLGPLYEAKADPATTSYHPRPEWYFYFLFYLLILFSNPNLVVLGTIGVPTIWLVILMLWPFIDRKKERRPSRRPVAMTAMVGVAAMLLTFSYLGSQAGKETSGGPEGLADAQVELPGHTVLFEDPGYWETCQACHAIGGDGGSVGPALDEVGTRYDLEGMTKLMYEGKGGMPAKGGLEMSDDEVAQVAAFLATLGNDSIASSPEVTGADAALIEQATGGN